MWVNITGMSLVMGGLSGLNTLPAQAFGAQSYHRVGYLLQRMMGICAVFCCFVFVLWWFFTATILRAVGMPEDTANSQATPFSCDYRLFF